MTNLNDTLNAIDVKHFEIQLDADGKEVRVEVTDPSFTDEVKNEQAPQETPAN